jgi:protein SCO1
MHRIPLPLALAGAALVAAAAGFATYAVLPKPAPAFHGTTYEETAPAADFRLTDHQGREVSLASYRGHPVLLFFGYTHCPDVCPLTLDRLSRVVRTLGGEAEDARIVLVTVDPARDTPAALEAYVSRFGPRVAGLTGDSASLARAWGGYGVYVEAQPSPGASAAHAGHGAPSAAAKVAHTGVVYGIDRQGRLRVVISDTATEEQTRDDVRTLAGL